MASCCAFSSVGHRWSSPGTVSDRIDLKQLECDVGGAYAPWGGARDGDDGEQNVSASISVNMSILNELCQYRDDDQRVSFIHSLVALHFD